MLYQLSYARVKEKCSAGVPEIKPGPSWSSGGGSDAGRPPCTMKKRATRLAPDRPLPSSRMAPAYGWLSSYPYPFTCSAESNSTRKSSTISCCPVVTVVDWVPNTFPAAS